MTVSTDNSKTRAALVSVGAAVFLLIVKFTVAWLTDSLGIFAEAMNSALDIVASVVTVAAVAYADRPADEDHQYGHGKAENLGAFIQSLILLVTCIGIGGEAVQRLIAPTTPVLPTIWAFGVMVLSVAISAWRVYDLRRMAASTHSQALEADALHFSTDIYTGIAVLIGLAGVWLGQRWGIPWLVRADAVAALVVVVVLLRMTWDLGRHAVNILLDRSLGESDQIRIVAGNVRGVERVTTVRTRQVGAQNFVELHIDVARATPFEESHAIATAVEEAISQLIPRSDVMVHVDPVQPEDEGTVAAIHAIALRMGIAIHHVSLHHVGDQHIAHLHLELPATLSLAAAHTRADVFEQEVVQEVRGLDHVESHIEPMFEEIALGTDVTQHATTIVKQVKRLAAQMSTIRDVHDITVQSIGAEYTLTFHSTFDEDTDLATVHEQMAVLERRLREQVPALRHVMIHPEPLSTQARQPH